MKIIITENKVENLRRLIKAEGFKYVAKLYGSFDKLFKIAFNNDLKELYHNTEFRPYVINSKGSMYIDKFLIDSLNLPIYTEHWRGVEKSLGEFKYTTKDGEFTFYAIADGPRSLIGSEQPFMEVIGMSDERKGFGYNRLLKRENLTESVKKKIYRQIIEKYNLDSYI